MACMDGDFYVYRLVSRGDILKVSNPRFEDGSILIDHEDGTVLSISLEAVKKDQGGRFELDMEASRVRGSHTG